MNIGIGRMWAFLQDPYLSPAALTNLKFYRYSSIDKSPLSKHVLRHWWDIAASLFPSWMAPNLITLAGFAFILINIISLALYLPDLIGPAPSWLYMSFSLGIFLYQTFDNVDGRQARKTGTSSALGHIFDHTIDSLNCALGGVLQAASLGVGHSPRAAILIFVASAAMWFSTWEEYHTGTLYLGYFNGPTEGLLLASIIHALSGIYGPQMWRMPLSSLSSSKWIPASLRLYDLVIGFALGSLLIVHIPECFANVRKARQGQALSTCTMLTQHVSYASYLLLVALWLFSPFSTVMSIPTRNEIYGGNLIEFSILATCSFGLLGPRIILARLTRSPFPTYNLRAFVPLLFGALVVNLPFLAPSLSVIVQENYILRCATVVSVATFLQWFTRLCRAFMVTLDVGCFSIKRRPAAGH